MKAIPETSGSCALNQKTINSHKSYVVSLFDDALTPLSAIFQLYLGGQFY